MAISRTLYFMCNLPLLATYRTLLFQLLHSYFVFGEQVTLCERDNEMSKKLMRILKKFRENDPSYHQLCYLVRQGEQPREGHLLLANLVEEQMGGTNGYVDWIIQLHRQVQQNP